MKYLTLSLILACTALSTVSAQRPDFSTIQSRDGIFSPSIQSFAVGDSLFVFFSTAGKKIFNATLILPDGAQKTLDLPELKNKAIAGIIPMGDDLHFYYFDESKSLVTVNNFSLHRQTLNRSAVNSI